MHIANHLHFLCGEIGFGHSLAKVVPPPQPSPQHLFFWVYICRLRSGVNTRASTHTHTSLVRPPHFFGKKLVGLLVGKVFLSSPPPLMTSDALLLQTTQKPQGRGSKVGKGVETESNQGKNSEKGTPSRSNEFPKRVKAPFGSGNLVSWNLIRSSFFRQKAGKVVPRSIIKFFPFRFSIRRKIWMPLRSEESFCYLLFLLLQQNRFKIYFRDLKHVALHGYNAGTKFSTKIDTLRALDIESKKLSGKE